MRLGPASRTPTPAISGNGAAIAPRPASSTELVSDDFPVFHWRHDARISYSCATASNDHSSSEQLVRNRSISLRRFLTNRLLPPVAQSCLIPVGRAPFTFCVARSSSPQATRGFVAVAILILVRRHSDQHRWRLLRKNRAIFIRLKAKAGPGKPI